MKLLHVYGQRYWHDDVLIVGNGEALVQLAHDILTVVAKQKPENVAYTVADGEGFAVRVAVEDAEFGDKGWLDLLTPYSDEVASDKRDTAIVPESYFVEEKEED